MKRTIAFYRNLKILPKKLFIIVLLLSSSLITIAGGDLKCDESKFHDYGPPPPPPPLREEILAAMLSKANYFVYWLNRGDIPSYEYTVFTDDGDRMTYSLGYGHAFDDVEIFETKLLTATPEDYPLFYWSDYLCDVYVDGGNGIFRPGGRKYAADNCTQFYGRPLCYEPDILPGTYECSWSWTGSMCYTMVYYCLVEADEYFKSILSPQTDAGAMLYILLNSRRVEEITRNQIAEGDLIFMDLDGNEIYDDHVGVISYVDANGNFNNDCCLGIIGFYPQPFWYSAAEASMEEFNSAMSEDWEFYDWFYVSSARVRYLKILAY